MRPGMILCMNFMEKIISKAQNIGKVTFSKL
jgi:hypothetical protein